ARPLSGARVFPPLAPAGALCPRRRPPPRSSPRPRATRPPLRRSVRAAGRARGRPSAGRSRRAGRETSTRSTPPPPSIGGDQGGGDRNRRRRGAGAKLGERQAADEACAERDIGREPAVEPDERDGGARRNGMEGR